MHTGSVLLMERRNVTDRRDSGSVCPEGVLRDKVDRQAVPRVFDSSAKQWRMRTSVYVRRLESAEHWMTSPVDAKRSNSKSFDLRKQKHVRAVV